MSELPAPLIVDMRVLVDRARERGMTPYQRGLSRFRAVQWERLNAARQGIENP